MATMILLANGTHATSSSDWENYGGSSQHDSVRVNDGNTSYVICDDNGEFIRFSYDQPSVAAANIDFDEDVSVRFLSAGRADDRRNASIVQISYASHPFIAAQSCSYDPSPSSHEIINGNVQNTSDGPIGTDWTYSDLEGIELTMTKNFATPVVITYLAIEVTYTAAEVSAENATFFGTNF